jgi:hypothetical protein
VHSANSEQVGNNFKAWKKSAQVSGMRTKAGRTEGELLAKLESPDHLSSPGSGGGGSPQIHYPRTTNKPPYISDRDATEIFWVIPQQIKVFETAEGGLLFTGEG